MTLLRLFTQLALASSALAIPLDSRDDNKSTGIQWGPCEFESAGTGPIECATLEVPLDYLDEANTEKATLKLLKSPALTTAATEKKSILFNFGGPGYEAVQSLNAQADLLHAMTGGAHDLVAFDPRGVAGTLTFSCYANATERQVGGLKWQAFPVDAYENSIADSYANMQAFSNACEVYNQGNKTPEFIGTAYVVRDMLSIVDGLGEDGLLRFWGMSYGSLLGATAAAMFPDRMDRILLDAVVDADNYYNHLGIDIGQLAAADASAREVLAQCIDAGPSVCALAALNSTAADLEATLVAAAARYAEAPVAPGTTVISARTILELLYTSTKYPADIANATMHLANLVTGTNLTEAAVYYDKLMGGTAMGQDDSLFGIKCGDTFPRAETVEGVKADMEYMIGTSELFGELMASIVTQCATWPWEAKERYGGPWEGIKTKTPLLFLGNTWDPATPMDAAWAMQKAFVDSVVFEQRGFGHGAVSQLSNCTLETVTNFFTDGSLPEDGTVCEVNTPLFATPEA